jgi:hypothetical protein
VQLRTPIFTLLATTSIAPDVSDVRPKKQAKGHAEARGGYRMKIAVAIAVILLSFGTFDEARADFLPGDFITFDQDVWGDPLTTAGDLLEAHFDPVYFSVGGLLRVGHPSGLTMSFTSAEAIFDYMPAVGTPGSLNSSLVNPLSSASGQFGGSVVALKLNIDFSDAGHTLGTLGIPYGDLVIHDYSDFPQVNDLTIRQVLGEANICLSGAIVCSAADFNLLLIRLNLAFDGRFSLQFAQDHLLLPSQQVPEPGTLVLIGIGVVALAVRRLTRGTRGSSSFTARRRG